MKVFELILVLNIIHEREFPIHKTRLIVVKKCLLKFDKELIHLVKLQGGHAPKRIFDIVWVVETLKQPN
ncbi:MAG TPA: hypothetical protein DEO43_04775 [Halieaceae bacterium]|nr:hypothetical protein [Halieaceae bacterium]